MTKVYDFRAQLAMGEAAELRIDRLWNTERWAVQKASRDEQRRGIDRWLIARDGSRRISLEYKTDAVAGNTGNAFVETVSVSTESKPGWAFSSQAEFLVYHILEPETTYIIRMSAIRNQLPRWQVEFPSREVANRSYKTVGLLVPLDEFERIADRVF